MDKFAVHTQSMAAAADVVVNDTSVAVNGADRAASTSDQSTAAAARRELQYRQHFTGMLTDAEYDQASTSADAMLQVMKRLDAMEMHFNLEMDDVRRDNQSLRTENSGLKESLRKLNEDMTIVKSAGELADDSQGAGKTKKSTFDLNFDDDKDGVNRKVKQLADQM